MTRGRRTLSMLVAVALAAASLALGAGAPVSAADEELGSGGEYHAIAPRVVLEAREGSKVGPVRRPLRTTVKGTRLDIPLEGVIGLPEDIDDVLAVMLNVQVWSATSPGSMTVFSSQFEAAPRATSLVFDDGAPTNNLVVSRVSAAGSIGVVLRSEQAGTAQVRISVRGWLSTTSSGARGSRLFATPSFSLLNSTDGVLGRKEVVVLDVRGSGPVPNSPDVVGVVLNVQIANDRPKSKRTSVTVTTSPPRGKRVADLVVDRGQTTSNVVFVPLDANGNVHLSNRVGFLDAQVHVVGYLIDGVGEGRRRGRIVPLSRPFVAVDTRSELSGDLPIPPGVAEDWDFAPTIDSLTYPDRSSVGPVSGVIGSFAAVEHVRQYPANPPSETDLRIYPSGGLPSMMNVFVEEGSRASNAVVARLSPSDRFVVYNRAGFTHYTLGMSAVILSDEAS